MPIQGDGTLWVGIHELAFLSNLIQIRVGLRKLNFYQLLHNLKDTVNTVFSVVDCIKDVEYFLLLSLHLTFSGDNFSLMFPINAFVQINSLPSNVLIQHILYDDKEIFDGVNESVPVLTLKFIHQTIGLNKMTPNLCSAPHSQ